MLPCSPAAAYNRKRGTGNPFQEIRLDLMKLSARGSLLASRDALATSGAGPCQIIIVHKGPGHGALGHYAGHYEPHWIVRGVSQMVAAYPWRYKVGTIILHESRHLSQCALPIREYLSVLTCRLAPQASGWRKPNRYWTKSSTFRPRSNRRSGKAGAEEQIAS
jgi:hypothetical protein